MKVFMFYSVHVHWLLYIQEIFSEFINVDLWSDSVIIWQIAFRTYSVFLIDHFLKSWSIFRDIYIVPPASWFDDKK